MNNDEYYLAKDLQQTGPHTLEQVRAMWAAKEVSGTTLFWKMGQAGWEPLQSMASLLGTVAPPPLSDAPSPLPRAQYPQNVGTPPPTSGLAITSLVLGILGLLTFVPSIPAVICGHVALGRIKQSSSALGGRSVAMAGLILGYLVVVLFAGLISIGLVAGLVLPILNPTTQKRREAMDLAKAKEIANAIISYEGDHDGRTPPNLAVLVPNYFPDPLFLKSPLNSNDEAPGYDLLAANADSHTFTDAPTTLLLRGRYRSRTGLRSYAYADGHSVQKHEP